MAKAAGNIDTSYLFLLDNFPGLPESRNEPYDNFLSTAAGHNVAAPTFYTPGQKIKVTDPLNGDAILMYGQLVDVSGTLAALNVLSMNYATSNTAYKFWKLTNDAAKAQGENGNNLIQTGMCAIALSAMTNNYYGWFWVGGGCPETKIPALAGNVATFSDPTAIPVGPVCIDAAGTTLALGEPLSAGSTGVIVRPCGIITKAAA